MQDTSIAEQLSAPGVDPTACISRYDPQTGLVSLANPRCSNPCIQERMVPGTWIADSSDPPMTHLSEGRLLTVAIDRHRSIWFDQGYLDRHDKFHLWPPLLAMTPTPYASDKPSSSVQRHVRTVSLSIHSERRHLGRGLRRPPAQPAPSRALTSLSG